jgi:Protein of unknown function (DUF4236)
MRVTSHAWKRNKPEGGRPEGGMNAKLVLRAAFPIFAIARKMHMAYLRYHRALKMLPGLRLNLAKTGPSLSLGTNGARLNVGTQGIRTTVGAPGSGLSLITRKSWGAMGDALQPTMTTAEVDTALDGMSHRKRRALFVALVDSETLPELRKHREAIEAYAVEHASEVEPIDEIDLADMRQIFADAIAAKEAEANRATLKPLALVAAGGIGIWAGIASGNGLFVAAGIVSLFAAGCTKAGQAFVARLAMTLLGAMGLMVAAAGIGLAALVILAMSGNF